MAKSAELQNTRKREIRQKLQEDMGKPFAERRSRAQILAPYQHPLCEVSKEAWSPAHAHARFREVSNDMLLVDKVKVNIPADVRDTSLDTLPRPFGYLVSNLCAIAEQQGTGGTGGSKRVSRRQVDRIHDEVMRHCGFSPTVYNKIRENKYFKLSFRDVCHIAEALDVSVAELVTSPRPAASDKAQTRV